MKIAYLFHGHSRTWKECYQSFFENVYSQAPGDIYIHTWDRINSKCGSFWNSFGEEAENISSQITNIEDIKKAYNPKDMIMQIDTGLEVPLNLFSNLSNIHASEAHIAVYNMFRSQRSVFKLTENYGIYDRYFSCRLDLFFTNKFNIEELKYDNCLTAPNIIHNGHYIDINNMVFDIFSFGSKDIMEMKSKFCYSIYDYWYSKGHLYDYWIEKAVTQYYRDNNIEIKPSSLQYDIKRLF
jgi:hypothetical protein